MKSTQKFYINQNQLIVTKNTFKKS